MKNLMLSWLFWALLSAGFAALTAIFAKIGIENVNSDFATFIRTVVILLVSGLVVYAFGSWQQPSSVSAKTWLFLVLSGAATGASWICYFRALKLGDAGRVAPVDKLSVVFVAVFAVLFLGERLALPNWLGVILITCGAVLIAHRP
jgi:transporter family protein